MEQAIIEIENPTLARLSANLDREIQVMNDLTGSIRDRIMSIQRMNEYPLKEGVCENGNTRKEPNSFAEQMEFQLAKISAHNLELSAIYGHLRTII